MPPPPPSLRRLLPLALLAGGLILGWGLGWERYLTLDALDSHRHQLIAWRDAQPVLAAVGYVTVYALIAAASFPGAAVLTLAGGFLFGPLWGTLWAVLGASLGATLLFLIARHALGDLLQARAGSAVRKLEDGFKANAFSYLLALRLVPLFPFWLVNLVPALVGVRLPVFVTATVLGIVPGGAVYAGLGHGLGAILAEGGRPDLGLIFRPDILLPLIGLAVLALLPVLWRRFKTKAHDPAP